MRMHGLKNDFWLGVSINILQCQCLGIPLMQFLTHKKTQNNLKILVFAKFNILKKKL